MLKDNPIGNTPDVTRVPRTEDTLVFIGCDGVFESMTNEQIIAEIQGLWQQGCYDPVIMAKYVVNRAYSLGSHDNISAMVAFATRPLDLSVCARVESAMLGQMDRELVSQQSSKTQFFSVVRDSFYEVLNDMVAKIGTECAIDDLDADEIKRLDARQTLAQCRFQSTRQPVYRAVPQASAWSSYDEMVMDADPYDYGEAKFIDPTKVYFSEASVATAKAIGPVSDERLLETP